MAKVIVLAVLVALLAALAAVVMTAFSDDGGEPPPSGVFVTQRAPWESAMRKAGVEATFPAGPVMLTGVQPAGGHPFEATFIARELAALLTVYRFESEAYGSRASLDRVRLRFPKSGFAEIDARVTLDGETYAARVAAPVTYTGDHVMVWPSNARLSIEGVAVGGRQRTRAISGLNGYINDVLLAAPGLHVDSARIVRDGVRVAGTAPDVITHPEPAPPLRSRGLAVATR